MMYDRVFLTLEGEDIMIKGLGVYVPMALLPSRIINELRRRYDPDIYRTSCMILKIVNAEETKYRFWIERAPEPNEYNRLGAAEFMADDLTIGEQTVVDTVLKVGAAAAIKEV